ncbi:MAG: T9SS type A sorting domain-containing protein, partial [Candidatus Eisenbacteria sp.]|nr:T9SS type A sorting domain-containing protein [Candidatus Eisenbacteria bacterium]
AINPNGIIIVVDDEYGLFYVEEMSGYVTGFGNANGTGYTDIEIDANGVIYLANTLTDRIERYDSDGFRIGFPFGYEIVNLGAVGVAGFTPTPEGEDVLVEPGESIEVTYEEVTSSGFTTAGVTVTTSRTSPEGNDLPAYADLPGTRADDFTYILLATDAVYEGLIQVDVLEEGSRLFYASGTSDTFRDFTVVGSVDDARGTIPRFTELARPGKRVETGPTEVVLVEDSRALSETTIYKFWRLELAMEVPDNMPGGDPCPWEYIEWLQKYPESARGYYDSAQYSSALSELAIMNGMIRSHAGSCIPDSSDDPLGNMVAHILAHSKTLMYSIGLESGAAFTGIDAFSSISLAVVNPGRGECTLVLSGPVGAEVAARIYSVSGRLVATVFEGTLPEGGETVVWNGLDQTGRPTASGVYFARVESGGEMQTAKLVYIR